MEKNKIIIIALIAVIAVLGVLCGLYDDESTGRI